MAILTGTASSQSLEWRPTVFLDNEIYPSYLVATANIGVSAPVSPYVLGNVNGVIGIYANSPAPNSKVRLTVKIDDAAPEQSFEFVLPLENCTYLLMPYIAWDWKALRSSRQTHPSNCAFTYSVNGSPAERVNQVVTIRSVNEALLGFKSEMPNNKNAWVPTTFVLASYVNEDHPWIDSILREALDTGVVRAFDGYQSGDPKQVLGQIWAVWLALQRRGFSYSSITQSAAGNKIAFSQHVRFLQDAITTSQANCVDGTIVLASILRKIGIETGIVTIPGHSFLVFRLAPGAEQSGLETTMIGSLDLRGVALTSDPKDPARMASLDNFLAAVTRGTEEFNTSLKSIMSQDDPTYSLTMIKDARQTFKIYPMSPE